MRTFGRFLGQVAMGFVVATVLVVLASGGAILVRVALSPWPIAHKAGP